ncbi:hypothetical protein FB451DRAFT_1454485 [Mycena latifolia]|nr:hypothetical protein FB451DRAFT_1454485 [Mycena latifolia]
MHAQRDCSVEFRMCVSWMAGSSDDEQGTAVVSHWVLPDRPARVVFGTPIHCDPTLTIVGGPAHFSSPALRIFSLTMYFLLLIPGINLLPPILFFLALYIAYNRSREHHRSSWERWDRCIQSIRRTLGRKRPEPEDGESQKVHAAFLVVGLVLLVVINIIFLVDIELTLSRNKHLQSDEDNQWGFGQVLALLLLVMPLRDAWNALRDIKKALRGVQKRFLQALREEVEATPFVERLEDLIREGAKSKECIEHAGFADLFQLGAYRGRKDIVGFFLGEESPADKSVIETNSSGTYGTALQAASANGHVDIVQLLLDKRTDKEEYINLAGRCYGTALCAACANEKFDVAEFLIKEGAKVELDGKTFGSPLHVASLVGNTKIITLLLENLRGGNPNTEWGIFGTALDVAKVLDNDKVVNLLKQENLTEIVIALHLHCSPAADGGFFTLAQQEEVSRPAFSTAHAADGNFFTLAQQRWLLHARATAGKSPSVCTACTPLTTAVSRSRNSPGYVALRLHCSHTADDGFFTLAQQWQATGGSPCVSTACTADGGFFTLVQQRGVSRPAFSAAHTADNNFFTLAQQRYVNGFFTLTQQDLFHACATAPGKSPCISTACAADSGLFMLAQQEEVRGKSPYVPTVRAADGNFFTLVQRIRVLHARATGAGKSPCIPTAHTVDDGFCTLVRQRIVRGKSPCVSTACPADGGFFTLVQQLRVRRFASSTVHAADGSFFTLAQQKSPCVSTACAADGGFFMLSQQLVRRPASSTVRAADGGFFTLAHQLPFNFLQQARRDELVKLKNSP